MGRRRAGDMVKWPKSGVEVAFRFVDNASRALRDASAILLTVGIHEPHRPGGRIHRHLPGGRIEVLE